MRIACYTLGCKVNQSDTRGLKALFREQGYQVVPFSSPAEVYLINTCVVTASGASKSRRVIRQAAQANPGALIVVTGCYPELDAARVAALEGVGLVVGLADRPRIVALVEQALARREQLIAVSPLQQTPGWIALPSAGAGERTRATLKIEEGCEEYCSYCIVPHVRGRVRSLPPEQVLRDFHRLVEQGHREIVLTGIHLGAYGKDLGLKLHQLLARLVELPGNFRIRLGSLEPQDLVPELQAVLLNHPRVCQHLHLPLQSGCDRILKLMRRHYDSAQFAALVAGVRRLNPRVALGADLIVGFPGETEADFLTTCDFLKQMAFSRVHVFRYSPRPLTPAADLPDRVAQRIQVDRSHRVQEIALQTGRSYAAQFIGQTLEVLFETKTAGGWSGWSGEYLRVEVSSDQNLQNKLVPVEITAVSQHLSGVIKSG